jgi:tetratricopeptide (TPR) repeat protein
MPHRFLVGPLAPEEAHRSWAAPRAAGSCLCFNRSNQLDLTIVPGDSWDDVRRRFPESWQPDFILLNLAFHTVPAGLWRAPLPLIGLAADWDVQWHSYRAVLPWCDHVLTDSPGVAVMRRAGMEHVSPMNLAGLPQSFLGLPLDGPVRDIDVLVVGTFSPAQRRERLAWLGRLASLADRRRILIRRGVPEEDYQELLWRSKIVFNLSGHGECNRRALEAAACGAVLFQEADNLEVPDCLAAGAEFVPYTDADFEDLLERYLTDEGLRRTTAEAAWRRVQGHTFDAFWQAARDRLVGVWEQVTQRCRNRLAHEGGPRLSVRLEQVVAARDEGDPGLVSEYVGAIARQGSSAQLQHGLALAVAAAGRNAVTLDNLARQVATQLQSAVATDPDHPLAALGLLEVLDAAPTQATAVAAAARHFLERLDRWPNPQPEALNSSRFPIDFDVFRCEWERAAWRHAGGPAGEQAAKMRLLRWRATALLARASDQLADYQAAATTGLPGDHAALGCALGRAGRPAEAVPYLRDELRDSPFDAAAARALYHALQESGDPEGAQRVAQSRRQLARAAPGLVALEHWFTEPVSVVAAPPRASLTMIVRDEEHNLPACLASVSGLFGEIIIVDTGSIDATKEIASRFGAKVVDFPWCDDFAAARNEALRHATGTWVFWLDADDRLDADNHERLRKLLTDLQEENVAYVMKCVCLSAPGVASTTVVDHVRLFRNRPDVRWKYRVHEQVLLAIRRTQAEVRWSDVVVHHTGYSDPALRQRKLERDLRLLHLENDDHPDDPFVLFNLGSVYAELGRNEEAIPLLRRSLERSGPRGSIVRKLYALLVGCYRTLKRPAEAAAACAEGLRVCPNDTELLFLDSGLRRERGDAAGAEACLLRLLHEHPGEHFASLDGGLRGHKACHNLAALYFQQGRTAEAERQWRAAVDERPDFVPAWRGLGEIALLRGNFAALEATASRLALLPGSDLDAIVLRARGHLARREWGAARLLLGPACLRHPRAVSPRLLLGRALLADGDRAAAEVALRAVLAIDPPNTEAGRLLDNLRSPVTTTNGDVLRRDTYPPRS